MNELKDAIIVVAIAGVIAVFAWLKARSESAQRQMVFEVQKQLIDKLSSGPEVGQFLASEEAIKFMEHLKPSEKPAPPGPSPAEVVFVMIWVGTITAFIGCGLLIGAAFVERKLIIPGAICVMAGIGMLVGLFITHQLAKKWGIFKNERAETTQERS